jgi:hypothetical protein
MSGLSSKDPYLCFVAEDCYLLAKGVGTTLLNPFFSCLSDCWKKPLTIDSVPGKRLVTGSMQELDNNWSLS